MALCKKWESYLRETFEETLQGGRSGLAALAEKAGGDPAPENSWEFLRKIISCNSILQEKQGICNCNGH